MISPVRKAAVVGAGVVGVPMAALLAAAPGGPDVVLIQRPSPSSAWKVDAVNRGLNPLGGIEPDLPELIARTVAAGRLRAAADPAAAADAEAVLVCVQTDKAGREPDYGPLLGALDGLAPVLAGRRRDHPVLLIIESTLAPSSLASVIGPRLASRGLVDGRDIDLGHSPNRVMPGRLVERIRSGDKIVSGLRPETTERILDLYRAFIPAGQLQPTDALTAETVKTLENAERDVRIAYSAEAARFCDAADIDFHALRAAVNGRLDRPAGAAGDPQSPAGGLLVPTVGVGGHCLPKDGILLLWRMLEAGRAPEDCLILEARRINDESPTLTAARIESAFGPLRGQALALLGAAYRPDAADTRNSPSMALARILRPRAASLTIHDPYVRAQDPRLAEAGLADIFSNDLEHALAQAEIVVVGTAHAVYREALFGEAAAAARAVFDGAHLLLRDEFAVRPLVYEGIGKGRAKPPAGLVAAVEAGLQAVRRGLANEIEGLASFLRRHPDYGAAPGFGLETIRRLAGTCATGCALAETGPIGEIPAFPGFSPRLPETARRAWEKSR